MPDSLGPDVKKVIDQNFITLEINFDKDVSWRPIDSKILFFQNSSLKLDISDSIFAEIFIQSNFSHLNMLQLAYYTDFH